MTPDSEVRLPRPPGMIRRAFAAHPRAVDITIVVWFFIGSAIGVTLDIASSSRWDEATQTSQWMGVPSHLTWPWVLIAVARILLIAATLLYRRRFPLAGLIVVVVVTFGEQGIQAIANGVALMFLLYAVPVYRSVAAGWLAYGISVFGTLVQTSLALWLGSRDVAPTTPADLLVADTSPALSFGEYITLNIMSALWLLAVLMLGINLGNRRRYIAAVIDRAHQLVRERDQLAQLAVAEERSRIAREMHDIVAHSVSVMIALSEGAARAAATAPDAASEAMRRSAETGRTALAEMRRLLGALHSNGEEADLLPQPGVDDLPQLIAGFRDAGLQATLEVTGKASGDRGQDLAVYRVVQEGLTNVLRYAGAGARARVSIERNPDRTTVLVRDYGPAPGAQRFESGVGSGRGLAGLTERARVFGGRIESGPLSAREGGGWRLWAVLPVSADASGVDGRSTPATTEEVQAPLPVSGKEHR
ncbi:sensor histidine kinase [Leucobacter sp. NPDC058333]|uniref:sensor histidine kinase n=1 Tax=Leucobacter sp. NPDC058333 TaxID=3346450 RepID=UPI003647581F